MQSEPIETSNSNPTQTDAEQPTNASQYGIFHDEHSAEVRNSLHETRISAESSPSPDAVDSQPSRDVRLRDELRRLSIGDRKDTRPKPSFQRISEYENALTSSPTRKQSEGPGFKIIKKKGNRLDAPQLDEFPNGMSHLFDALW